MFGQKNDESKLVLKALRNAASAVLYVVLVVFFMSNANRIFGTPPVEMLIGAFMLTLFVVSALIESILVLGQPVWLFTQGKRTEALKLLGYTTGFMVLALLALMLIMLVAR
ncbi:MAG: hypothetical protein PHT12_00320 [Patescibacteria group bacterium]|nr:hypothetical protein [Patescibacteria group bacterium]